MKNWFLRLSVPGLLGAFALLAAESCTSTGKPGGTVTHPDAAPPPTPSTFCALPGSVVWTAQGPSVVSGPDAGLPDVSWLTLPAGFCVHAFGTLGDVRQIRFSPGGDLFATSPTKPTSGGTYAAGRASIVVMPDDNGDGVADTIVDYLGTLPATQGFLFGNGFLYYQDGANVMRVPFQAGDRTPSGASQTVATITAPQDELHWAKAMDIAQDGTIYVTNGGSQADACLSTDPTRGAIFAIEDGGATLIAKGFRNPIALRCETNHDVCLAAELALDYSAFHYGREKVVPIRPGDNWGYPCCATQNLAYEGTVYTDTSGAPDCSGVAAESDSFVIGQTPFGLDFAPASWPAPWAGRVLVTLHGQVGTWAGASVLAAATDPDSGAPLPASDLVDAGPSPSLMTFATGWDDGKLDHGRPAPIAVAPDGRVFIGDDVKGLIFWVAPIGLTVP